MDYELAKQLKDAGFPQKNHFYARWSCFTRDGMNVSCNSEWWLHHIKRNRCWFCQYDHSTLIYEPTLSELIEACGEKFYNLTQKDKDYWWCSGTFGDVDDSVGKTPEEAVARLWLELNKKNEAS